MDYTLVGGTVVSHGKKAKVGSLSIQGERIVSRQGAVSIDLGKKSCVYPSLINTHDHLQGAYLPSVGPKPGTFYLTWLPWDGDFKASETYKERSKLDREELYALAGYKCLFSGVTTVNDHFPHEMNEKHLPNLPIRAISEYCLSHECSSYDLDWGDGVELEHKRAVKNGWPFITHLCEGFEWEAMHGVQVLENFGSLDSHCLLVHCIAISDKDIKKLAKAKASVAWCPRSNMFMFNVTAKIRKMIKAGVNVTLGTDSSATGSENLLAELKYGRELYRRMYGEDLSPVKLFEMVTCNAARAFWMGDRVGTLDEGKLGDVLVLKTGHDNPYENLVNASMGDIELLVLAGRPIYGELRFLDIFGGDLPPGYSRIEVGGRGMFVKGDPQGLYDRVRRKIGFRKILGYLPFDPPFDPEPDLELARGE
ncbi:MAG: amidohydrolase family protein [Treponema sp.]|nr:amidohydrolase family protein [Treponema sp.]